MRIQLQLGDLLLSDQQLGNFLGVASPNLRRKPVLLSAVILEGGLEHHWHHETAVVLKVHLVKIPLLLE